MKHLVATDPSGQRRLPLEPCAGENGGSETGGLEPWSILVVCRAGGSAFPELSSSGDFLVPIVPKYIKIKHLGHQHNARVRNHRHDTLTHVQWTASTRVSYVEDAYRPRRNAVWQLPLVGLGGYASVFIKRRGIL